jgi:hypothetical protein
MPTQDDFGGQAEFAAIQYNRARLLANMRAIAEVFRADLVLEDEDAKFSAPFGNVNGWTVVCDGHLLVVVEGEFADAVYPVDAHPPAEKLLPYYVAIKQWEPPAEVAPVSLAALRAWAGAERVATIHCSKCGGTGHGVRCPSCHGNGSTLCVCEACDNEHRAKCDACPGGLGWQACEGCGLLEKWPSQPGILAGVGLNRSILANALRFLPGETARVIRHEEPNTDKGAVWIAGDGWRVAVMALVVTEDDPDIPRFGAAQ